MCSDFPQVGNCEAFEQNIADGLERYDGQLFRCPLMPNHWQVVWRPQRDGEVSRNRSCSA